ncbi:MAG: glycosyltransferase family 4 protein [Acidimicrobiia bacterium]|nr:glycosyltransferase family 4 protein [Acidimicrobiia bacterium]
MMQVAAVVEQSWHRVPGGTARATNETLAALTAHPDAPGLIGVAARHRHPPEPTWEPPVPVRHFRLPRRALYAGWLMTRWPPVEDAAGPVDVIHATSAAVPPRTAPIVASVYDLAFLHHPDHASRVGQRFFERSWSIIRDEVDIVACPSAVTADDCVAHGIDRERVRVVPLGTHASPASDEAVVDARSRFRLPPEFILWVGTIEPRKNLTRLVEAVALLGDAGPPLVLVGPTGWGEQVESYGHRLGRRLRVLGFVDDDELRALYRAASVFAYPSLLEGFGLPVLEAMAQGTVVVTSAGTATEEVCGGGGVCVDPLSVPAIADALDRLLADETERGRLGAAGAARAAEATWERTAELTLAAYRDAARV